MFSWQISALFRILRYLYPSSSASSITTPSLKSILSKWTSFVHFIFKQHICEFQVAFQYLHTRSLPFSLGCQSHCHYYHRSPMNNRRFNLSFPFPNRYPCSSILTIFITGIRAATNKKGDRGSPWHIPRLILTSPNLLFLDNKTVPHLFILFLSISIMFAAIPTSSRVFSIQLWGTTSTLFENQPMPHWGLFSFSFYS